MAVAGAISKDISHNIPNIKAIVKDKIIKINKIFQTIWSNNLKSEHLVHEYNTKITIKITENAINKPNKAWKNLKHILFAVDL